MFGEKNLARRVDMSRAACRLVSMNNTHTDTRKAQLFARATTATLYQAAVALEAARSEGLTPDQRMARAWLLDELEQRAGKLTDAELPEFERIYDQTDNYLAALVALRPNLIG